jgi:histidine triad (HIT) family protein
LSAKPCPFCAIVRGEADAARVYEDAAVLAFLDKAPLVRGHVLVVPKVHVGTIWEADEATTAALALASRRLALAVKTAMAADGAFVAQNNVVSQSVPHLHVHIIPRTQGDGFFSPRIIWRRVKYRDAADMAETAARIAAASAGAA